MEKLDHPHRDNCGDESIKKLVFSFSLEMKPVNDLAKLLTKVEKIINIKEPITTGKEVVRKIMASTKTMRKS